MRDAIIGPTLYDYAIGTLAQFLNFNKVLIAVNISHKSIAKHTTNHFF